jgi:uncharacterized protein with FMN-binding domain
MRRAALAIVSTVAGLVMLLSFKTHGTTAVAIPPAALSIGGTSSSSTTATTGGTNSSTAATSTKTYTGAAADTRYGPVQVQITVANGALASVQAITYPMGNGQDQQINSYAIPVLNQEAASAKSANIDTVSGATFTSDGYRQSLQSALDQANL